MKYVYFISYCAIKGNRKVTGTCEYESSVKLNTFSRRLNCARIIAKDSGFLENSVTILNCEFSRRKLSFSKSS